MFLNQFRFLMIAGLVVFSAAGALASDDPWFHEKDPLTVRDEWGVFHQSAVVNQTDFLPRYGARYYYYFKSAHELLADPAYVAGLQVSLRHNGYYCGPIDGIMSLSVNDAIARLQKNHVQRVTGTLTVAVRRSLHLP
jgi:hypothetical protein